MASGVCKIPLYVQRSCGCVLLSGARVGRGVGDSVVPITDSNTDIVVVGCPREQSTDSFSTTGGPRFAVAVCAPYKYGTCQCTLDEPFVNNGEFEIIAGRQWFDGNGDLKFPLTTKTAPDTFYRTVGGPGVAHAFVVFGRSDINTMYALRRLTGVRDPLIPGRHAALKEQQKQFIMRNMHFYSYVKFLYAEYFNDYRGMDEEARLHHADEHEKKELRIEAWKQLNITGQRFKDHLWVGLSKQKMTATVTGKQKPEEYAKAQKRPRMIMDISVQGSLVGFRSMELVKMAQASVPIEYAGGEFIFVKSPDQEVMRAAFEKVRYPRLRFCFVYFSDDSILSYWWNGQVYYHNIDISSCDASHTAALFDVFLFLYPDAVAEDLALLVQQCMLPIKIRSVQHPKMSVTLKPREPHLYTGSTLTTGINNTASLTIGLSIALLPEIRPDLLVGAAESCGYKITGEEPLKAFEELQFLKHSPVVTTHGVKSIINFGVFLRASGTIKRDYPGRGDILIRAASFQKSLINGIFPYVDCPYIRKLKQNFAESKDCEISQAYVEKHFRRKVGTSLNIIVLTDDEFFSRYNPTAEELGDLYAFARAGVATVSNFPILDRILRQDYQLGTTEHNPVPVYMGQMFSHKRLRS